MSDIFLDTCSIVNLNNADALACIFSLVRHKYFVGNYILGECGNDCPELENAIVQQRITRLDDSEIPASVFADLLELYGLGDGETESLMFAQFNPNLVVCSDDRAARRTATSLFGAHRVIGSIGLLRHCIEDGLLTSDAAFILYEQMVIRGGFFPALTIEDFRAHGLFNGH